MRRQWKLLEFALSALIRRRGKNLSILVVYTLTVATLASVLFLTGSLRTEARQVLQASPELVVQRLMAGRHELIPLTDAAQIRSMPGVKVVQPRVWGYYYDAVKKVNFTLMGWREGITPVQLLQGALPQQGRELAIGQGIANAYGVSLGDQLLLVDAAGDSLLYTIIGLFAAESRLLTNDLILLPEDELRRFFNMPSDRATDLTVSVYNPREVSTLAKKIRYHLPDSRPIGRAEILHTYDTVFHWRSGMLLTVALAALVAFCILAWDKATGISADERREIGVLKAIGWDTADILALKFWEGLALSLTAFFLGTLLAWAHTFLWGAGLLAPVIKGWSVLFPEFDLTPSIDLYQLFVLAMLTITPYIACTVIPSWSAAVTDPDSAMRG